MNQPCCIYPATKPKVAPLSSSQSHVRNQKGMHCKRTARAIAPGPSQKLMSVPLNQIHKLQSPYEKQKSKQASQGQCEFRVCANAIDTQTRKFFMVGFVQSSLRKMCPNAVQSNDEQNGGEGSFASVPMWCCCRAMGYKGSKYTMLYEHRMRRRH